MDKQAQQLLNLKTEIEEIQSQLVKLNTEEQLFKKQMKKEFGINTKAEAEKQIKKLEKEYETLTEEIQAGMEELEKLIDA